MNTKNKYGLYRWNCDSEAKKRFLGFVKKVKIGNDRKNFKWLPKNKIPNICDAKTDWNLAPTRL